MPCPSDARLALWAERRLPKGQARSLARHIEECLVCRLVTGAMPPDLEWEPSEDDQVRARARFEKLLPRLRAAFLGREASGGGGTPIQGQVSEESEPLLLMAADTRGRLAYPAIPPWYAESGRLVVTFHIDPVSELVSAHLVSDEPDRIRFRAVQLGERIFVSDAEGRVGLCGLTVNEVLGMRTHVPAVLCRWEITPAPGLDLALRSSEDLDSGPNPGPGWILRLRIKEGPEGYELQLQPEGSRPPLIGAVLLADRSAATFVRLSEGLPALGSLGSILPETVQVSAIASS